MRGGMREKVRDERHLFAQLFKTQRARPLCRSHPARQPASRTLHLAIYPCDGMPDIWSTHRKEVEGNGEDVKARAGARMRRKRFFSFALLARNAGQLFFHLGPRHSAPTAPAPPPSHPQTGA